MIENVSVRQATLNDIPFIVEAICESEKSSSEIISSCKVFNFTEEKFREILKEILAQDIEHYDYYLSGFLVAELNRKQIGALGSWLEGADNTVSGILKATSLFPYLDKSSIKLISANTKIVKGLSFNREKNTLQLEHGYVVKNYRRQGVFSKLLAENIKRNYAKYGGFEKVQGILFKDNFKSFYAHLKFGYVVAEEKIVSDPEIFNFFPFNKKVLMEFHKDKIVNLVK